MPKGTPGVAKSILSLIQPPGLAGTELATPLPNGFVEADYSVLGKKIPTPPKLRQSVVHPGCMTGDIDA